MFNHGSFQCVWLLAIAVLLPRVTLAQSNGLLREVWYNVPGSTVPSLTNNPAFPASPSADAILTNGFEAPINVSDQYGQRLRALLSPPTSGNYIFYIASDDSSELWLSTDENPANRRLIARVPTWTDSRVWQETRDNNYLAQKSTNIALVAGRSYYIEALMKEEGGGDNLAVTWQRPGDAVPANGSAPIPNQYLRPYGAGAPVIVTHPISQTVTEGGSVTFSIQLGRNLGATYQWIRNGTNIPGATGPTYSLAPLTLADSNHLFQCRATNPFGSAVSSNALLRVMPDTTRPSLVSISHLGDNHLLTVLFSEPMESSSASTASNYSLNNGAQVLAATLLEDGVTLALQTTPLTWGQNYTLTVNNLRDRAQTPNTILPNTQRSFAMTFAPLDMGLILGSPEPAGPSSRRSGLTITEIMYHPTNRADGRNLEFVEIYNSNPWREDLTGHRLSGMVDFRFPAGTSIGPLSYLAVAAVPADLQAVYGLSDGVLGPLTREGQPGNTTNVLDNGGGTIRLRDELDSVLVEAVFGDEPPYPAAPDGTGHSLVLWRPSYGADDPRAWKQSDLKGGSPRTNDVVTTHPHRTVLINEFLAHTDPGQPGFIELYNHGGAAVDLSGCWLSDDPATNRFRIPPGTSLPARGFLTFDETQLGFGLDSAGETLFLLNPAGNRVIDCIRYGAQERGIATGRFPDGAPDLIRLSQASPSAANQAPLVSEVVINEIMYNPPAGDAQEYVELHNRSSNAVSLAGWRLRGGISYTFPTGTMLPAGGYMVVAADATALQASHPTLTPANCVGNFSGNLGNQAERIILEKPVSAITTNHSGGWVTNQLRVAVDEVRYADGGRWGQWADGGGSSLELTDARADKRFAPAWADSDESARSDWVTVESTGVLDHGAMASPDQLHLFLHGAGECLVDNVEVIPQGGVNVVPNGTFESGVNGWVFQGTQAESRWETNGGYASARSLRLVATGRGDTGANRVRAALTQTLSPGTVATLRAKVKWLKGHPEILLRLRGNYLEATTNILATRTLGTPGGPNTRRVANAGPAITDVKHYPVLPAAGQAVTVVARVSDPDGLSSLVLRYRLDPAQAISNVVMTYNGAGYFRALIPGQSAGARVAFHIAATDNHPQRAASVFPPGAPGREALIRFGESNPSGSFWAYRLWCSQTNVTRWATREKNSDAPVDATFVYGDFRAVYNASARYKGSPWHAPSYNSPDGNACDYKVELPSDDGLLASRDLTLVTIGNLGSDASLQGEQTAFWIIRKLGAPYMYRRFIRMFFNGQQRQAFYEDACQPNSDTVSQFFPGDDNGSLHKVEDWFEFDDTGDVMLGNVDATLQLFTTSGGAKKTARYRYIFRPRAYESANDWTNLFALVDAMNATQPEPYESQVAALVDVDAFMRELAAQRIVGNWDSWGYARGKNSYLYKPTQGRWTILPWDIDFVFNSGGNGTSDALFGSNEPILDRFRNWPVFRRAYWRAFDDAVNGPLTPAALNARLDPRYSALVASESTVGSPQGIKDYLAARRAYIQQQLATVAAPFQISGPATFATNRNLITLSGSAPVGVATIRANGVAYPITWTGVTTWTMRMALAPGLNAITIQGYNSQGQPLTTASNRLNITFTGPPEQPEDKVVINEIMYQPMHPEAEFLEILNSSASNAFDLSLWRVEGVDGVIPAGTILPPGGLAVLVRDAAAFTAAYGSNIPIAAQFSGRLDNAGETIRLIQPASGGAPERLVDEVTYEPGPPWPQGARGGGFSLQLIDPSQDNQRVGNWSGDAGASEWTWVTTNGLFTGTNLLIQLTTAGDVYIDDLSVVPQGGPLAGSNVVVNGGFESDLAGSWIVPTNMAASSLSTEVKRSGASSLHLVTSVPATSVDRMLRQAIPAAASNTICTLSFWCRAGSAGTNLVARGYPGSQLRASVVLSLESEAIRCTPGAPNSVRAPLEPLAPLWLNEIQPLNLTGATDRHGHRHPWVEIYNAGSNAVSLQGWFLSARYDGSGLWPFPPGATVPPRGFALVWLDGHPEESTETEWHADFEAPYPAGSLALLQTNAAVGGIRLVDYLNHSVPGPARSYGNYPDGHRANRRLFSILTPLATNNPASAALPVVINEWMADNTSTLADPADGNYEDWFELFNLGDEPADLSGYYLTDDLARPFQYAIPLGTVVPARGWLLVWADGEAGQNAPGRDLHVSFQLAKAGEAIGLFGADGSLVDAVTFGPQVTDQSMGRQADGTTNITFLPVPTPGFGQGAPTNHAPVLQPIPDQWIEAGTDFVLTNAASDPDLPAQALLFGLDPGAPAGMTMDPATGVLRWTPALTNSPGSFPVTVRVRDNGVPPLEDAQSFLVTVLDPASPLRMSIEPGATTEVRIRWPAVPGRSYQLQHRLSLADGVWSNLGPPLQAATTTIEVTNQLGQDPQRFYRVLRLP